MRINKSLTLIALLALLCAGGMDIRPANAMITLQQPGTLRRVQQSPLVETGAFTDMNTMLFPFYKAESWINNDRKSIDLRSFLLKSGMSDRLILPAQEPGKTTVFFKGHITSESVATEGNSKGKINLVLRIYDQADGGTQLYEGIHEVRVTDGQYTAVIQIPSETIANNKTIWLEASSVEEKQLAFEPRYAFYVPPDGLTKPDGVIAAASTSYYIKSVALCYTCGGDAPNVNGILYLPAGTTIYEFGPGCTGGSNEKTWADTSPEVCVGRGNF